MGNRVELQFVWILLHDTYLYMSLYNVYVCVLSFHTGHVPYWTCLWNKLSFYKHTYHIMIQKVHHLADIITFGGLGTYVSFGQNSIFYRQIECIDCCWACGIMFAIIFGIIKKNVKRQIIAITTCWSQFRRCCHHLRADNEVVSCLIPMFVTHYSSIGIAM